VFVYLKLVLLGTLEKLNHWWMYAKVWPVYLQHVLTV